MIHVDDALYGASDDKYLDEINKGLNELCPTTEHKQPDKFRGIEITDSYNLPKTADSNGARWIKLSQDGFIKDLPAQYGFETKHIPSVPCPQMQTSEDMIPPKQASNKDIKRYMQIQGSLQWCMLTVPACNFTVNWLARHMQNPQPRHIAIQKLLQCLMYMYGHATQGCVFRRQGPPRQLRRGSLVDA